MCLALWPANATMPTILAHRGNINGPVPLEENRLPMVRRALRRGWGLEIDIRRTAAGHFYLSHDALPSADDGLLAETFFAELRRFPAATVALNIKELGYETELLKLLAAARVTDQIVLFDMELIEPIAGETARRFRAIDPYIRIAARVSDRGESIERALALTVASVIWLDEFDTQWATAADIHRLRAAHRKVFAVSPDLHRFPIDRTRARWTDFRRWGVDAICTDYPADLERLLAGSAIEVTA